MKENFVFDKSGQTVIPADYVTFKMGDKEYQGFVMQIEPEYQRAEVLILYGKEEGKEVWLKGKALKKV